jgi:DNA-binding MarR family transcriptional regulator
MPSTSAAESDRAAAKVRNLLMSLVADTGKTMGGLAREWCCDASNATWVIDRLERLGFAERRPSPTDCRAKLVVLTAKGAKAKSEILDEFRTPHPHSSHSHVATSRRSRRSFRRCNPLSAAHACKDHPRSECDIYTAPDFFTS